ncbi:MAG: hypothetical protein AVDCRST_MAG91-566, partial [uncultured Sphingomonadaceae bacterium]
RRYLARDDDSSSPQSRDQGEL